MPTIADLRRMIIRSVAPFARKLSNAWNMRANTLRYACMVFAAIGTVASVAFMSLRNENFRIDAKPASVDAPAVAAEIPVSTTALILPRIFVSTAIVTAPISTSASVASSPITQSSPVESDHQLLSEASTMDLMMPIAEPDLDIGSRQSLWSQVGKTAGVDPLLLYSVALVESKALYPNGRVAPTPWLFRVNDHLVRGQRHDVQLAMAAASQFGSAVQDVGIMQVYYPMHRDAVRDPLTLLNPRTNISVAAKILHDGMRQTRDPVLGVGYYHSHTPSLARDYGAAVLTVYQRLKAIHRSPMRKLALARP